VQRIKTYDGHLAERFFCPEECRDIAAVSGEERNIRFYRYWTLKESFIKNLGRGLTLPLNQFGIQLSDDRVRVMQQILPEETFYFREFDLNDGYRYACCARKAEISDVKIVALV